jgi:hypothetical protein
MWITTYHRFTNRAGFLAACEAAGWGVQAGEPLLPQGVALDVIGPLIGPASVGAGGAPIPGEMIDPRYHVNLSWHAREPAEAFAASQVTPDEPNRVYDNPPRATPAAPVPASIPAWKARAALREAGLLPAVTAAVEAAEGRVADAWNGAAEWHRDSAFLAHLAAGLGLSIAQVDDLFRAADAIRS